MPKPRRVHYTKAQVIAWLYQRYPEVPWDEVEELLPPIVWRSRWDKLAEKLGLPYTRKHLSNLDSRGVGIASFPAEQRRGGHDR